MSCQPSLTRVARAERQKQAVAAYCRGLSSRQVAAMFGLNDSHVRYVMRLYGVARRPGRPAT